ncbi:MAG: hypothetical protein ABFD80_01815 [Acidobacteriota bacterium]
MNLRRSLPAALAVLLCFGFVPPFAPGTPPQEGDYSQAVFTAVFPGMIKVTKETGNLELFLKGKNLLVHPPGDIWNVREIFVYVRHADKGEPWRGLYNNLREDYPNLPLENGSCAYDSAESLRVWLPKALWCSAEGQLEFLLVKGKFDGTTGELLVQVKSTSAPFKVAVRWILDGAVSRADELYPAHYVVHQADPPPLQVRGAYGPDSVVVVDGNDWPVTNGQAAPGWLTTAGLPAGFLDSPGKHTVTIRDQQNSPCVPATLWVYGPPVVTAVAPKGLPVGGGQANLEFTCEGLLPDKAEVRVGYVYSAPAPGGQPGTVQPAAAIPPKTDQTAGRSGAATKPAVAAPAKIVPLAKAGAASQTAAPPASDEAPKKWTDIAFGTHGGRIQVTIPAAWLAQEGTIKVRLTNKAGSVEAAIPIKKPVTLSPTKTPVKILK